MNNLYSFVPIFFTIVHQTVAYGNNRGGTVGRLEKWSRADPNASPLPVGFDATDYDQDTGAGTGTYQKESWSWKDPGYLSPSPGSVNEPAHQAYANLHGAPRPNRQKVKCNWCMRPQCKPGACQAAPNFDAKADAQKLKDAMEGPGTREEVLFDILINRSEEQIMLIRQEYLSFGKKSLEHDVEEETSFNVEDLLLALIKPRAEFFADELHRAFKKLDDKAMNMIYSSLPPCAIREVNYVYYRKRGKNLLKSVKRATVLKFEEFLEELTKTNRVPDGNVDHSLAKNDAKALWKAGPDSWIKKKRVFIDIFTHRSFQHIREVKEHYNKLFAKPNFDKNIAKHSGGGKLTDGLVALLRNIEDQPGYFADEVEGALSHLIIRGKRDNSVLIRILRGRCGIDLGDIIEAYPKNHDGKSLEEVIKEKKFLDFEKPLLQLITPQKVN